MPTTWWGGVFIDTFGFNWVVSGMAGDRVFSSPTLGAVNYSTGNFLADIVEYEQHTQTSPRQANPSSFDHLAVITLDIIIRLLLLKWRCMD